MTLRDVCIPSWTALTAFAALLMLVTLSNVDIVHCQSSSKISELIKGETQISKFVNLLEKQNKLRELEYNQMGAFAPSNVAIQADPSMAPSSATSNSLDAYLMQDKAFMSTDVWAQLEKTELYTANEDGFSELAKVQNTIGSEKFWLRTKKTRSNNFNGGFFNDLKRATNGFYTVIDQTGQISLGTSLLDSFSKLAGNLKTSEQFWKELATDDQTKMFVYFKDIKNNKNLYGTVFVPTDEAWKSLTAEQLQLIKNDKTVMKMVLGNHYAANQIILKTTKTKNETFKSGFPVGTTKVSDLPTTGSFQMVDNKITVQSGETQAKVIQLNVPFKSGYLHIIDKVFFPENGREVMLRTKAKEFMKAIEAFSDLKQAAKSSAYVLPINDANMAKVQSELNGLSESQRNQYLSMHFLDKKIASGNGYTVWSVNGASVDKQQNVRFLMNGKKIIRVDGSLNAKSGWTSMLVTQDPTTTVEGSTLFVDNLIGKTRRTCSDLMKSMSPSLKTFASRLAQLNISLDLGSPYTVFAATDAAFTSMQTDADVGQKIMRNSARLKYVLQRMIVANRVVASDIATAITVKMANMNFAGMKEYAMLKRSASTNSDSIETQLTFDGLSPAEVDVDKSGGLVCITNNQRENLIYPTGRVLYGRADLTRKFCVSPVTCAAFSCFLQSPIALVTVTLLTSSLFLHHQ